MLTTGSVPLPKLQITTDFGVSNPQVRFWADNTHYVMTWEDYAGNPAWLNFSFLGPDPTMRTHLGTQVEPFTLTDVPDPPWLVEATTTWINDHAPTPPPGDPQRPDWVNDLLNFIHQTITDHEAEE